jgi:hypothetical protein
MALLVALCILVPAAVVWQRPAPPPVALGRAGGTPVSILRRAGAWYWLEQTKKNGDRLMRATSDGVKMISSAEELPRYAVEDGRLVWSARQAGRWSILAANSDGGEPRTLWSGTVEPMGLALYDGRLYWLQQVPAAVPDGDPFPPLSTSLEAFSLARDGGAVTSLGRIWEAGRAEVLGFHSGALYVAAYRLIRPGSLYIYRLMTNGAPAVRVVGESGNPPALLTHAGVLYWLAPSQETLNAFRLRRLDDHEHTSIGQKAETLSDWLPDDGALYETVRGVFYQDHQAQSALWPAGRQDVFPASTPVPAGYRVLAAGEDAMLLASADSSFSSPTLYWSPLP